jgi:hypothetical protein
MDPALERRHQVRTHGEEVAVGGAARDDQDEDRMNKIGV